MKKETVNLFGKGLNYDLNPLTTPNDVLTDCVNGTFITFNGDELILQNDAGNTKILVSESESDPQYVQLPDGFYPIGMKEYGGILYIVSTDENNIEFGSYPSPEVYKWDSVYSNGTLSVPSSSDLTNFYRAFILNDNLFTAGTKIIFTNEVALNADFTDLTTFSSYTLLEEVLTKTKRLYNLRLVQLLENGEIDLTEDVWRKFLRTNPIGPNPHWMYPATNFVYNCPNNFKGKLAVIIEIEDLDEFKLDSLKIDEDRNLSVDVLASNNSLWSWGIDELELECKFDNGSPSTEYSFSLVKGIWKVSGIPIPTDVKILTYTIKPRFSHGVNNYELSEFPDEFSSKYILSGTLDIVPELEDVEIKLFPWDQICEDDIEGEPTGYKTYTKISISDLQGNAIDPFDGSIPQDWWFLYNETLTTISGTEPGYFGKFKVNNIYPFDIVFASGVQNQDILKSKLQSLPVRTSSPECRGAEVTLEFTDTLEFNANTVMDLWQGRTHLSNSIGGANLITKILENTWFSVTISGMPSWTVPNYYSLGHPGISAPTTFKIAPELRFYIQREGNNDYLCLDRKLSSGVISVNVGSQTIALGDSENNVKVLIGTSNPPSTLYDLEFVGTEVVSGDFLNTDSFRHSDFVKYQHNSGGGNYNLVVKKFQTLSS